MFYAFHYAEIMPTRCAGKAHDAIKTKHPTLSNLVQTHVFESLGRAYWCTYVLPSLCKASVSLFVRPGSVTTVCCWCLFSPGVCAARHEISQPSSTLYFMSIG